MHLHHEILRRAAGAVAMAGLLAFCGSVRAEPGQRHLTPAQAVSLALRRNLSLTVERLSPTLSDAAEQKAEAAFEPALFAEVGTTHSPGQVSSQRAGLSPASSTGVTGEVGISKDFSTGTSLSLSMSTGAQFGGGGLDPAYQSGVTLSARQSLLSGILPSANEVDITKAKMDRAVARRTVARKAEDVAVDTLEAYFELHAALAKDQVQALAVQVGQTTLESTLILIQAGKLAASEAVSARYTLATLLRDQLKTRQAVADARDTLARLVGLVDPGSLDTPVLVTVDTLRALPGPGSLDELQKAAMARREDYLAALEQVKLEEIRVKAARHFLLPTLDLVGSFFVTGLSGELSSSTSATATTSPDLAEGYWSSYAMNRPGWSAALVFELPLGNKTARAALQTAELELRRAKARAELVQQNISLELNLAWRALELAREQLALTRVAEQVAQQKLRNEQERYNAGKTTAHILASVQADATKEQLARATTEADLSKALVTLHNTAGTLLERLRIAP